MTYVIILRAVYLSETKSSIISPDSGSELADHDQGKTHVGKRG